MSIGFQLKKPLLFLDSKKTWIFLTGFQTIFKYQNSWKLSSGSRVAPSRWTDIMKLLVDPRDVVNVPKNGKGSYVKMFSKETDFVSTTCLPDSTLPPHTHTHTHKSSFWAVNSLYYKPTCAYWEIPTVPVFPSIKTHSCLSVYRRSAKQNSLI